jgi:hypothetical protein
LKAENFILQLISLIQRSVWDSVYDSSTPSVNINGLVKDLQGTLEESKPLNQLEITQALGGFALAYCLRDRPDASYNQLMTAL